MSISGISGLNVALYPPSDRVSASGQQQTAQQQTATTQPAVTPPPAATTGFGTVGALSVSVLAALMGNNLQLFGTSSGV
jgi:hypothetical protein